MKIIKKIAIWFILLLYLLPAASFVGNKYDKKLCHGIEVTIVDSLKNQFLHKKDIIQMLEKNSIKYLGIPLNKVDLWAIEKVITSNHVVSRCKSYIAINGILHIDISQKTPFVRIITHTGKGFYLDREGNVLKLSGNFSPHILVVNGHINTTLIPGGPLNVNSLNEKKLQEIYELALFISDDPLWNSQIQQVYINIKGEYELIPRIGPHIILLGKLHDYREKFEKLEIFYKEGLNHVGWNQYKIINLKYKDQVVCTKI